VFDQGQLGSCTGNGIASELEAQAIAEGNPVQPFSRLFIYYNERVSENNVNTDSGADIRTGIKSVATQGVCLEFQWPYDISKFTNKPPDSCYEDALQWEALKYESVTQNLMQIKSALNTGRGLVIGISVYPSFESDDVAKTGIVPMPNTEENLLGGHCVRLCGFSDIDLNDIPAHHFIGQNSWGTSWGKNGYFFIPYDYILNSGLASDFWLITVVGPSK
jgi:C1A family cysteine protease